MGPKQSQPHTVTEDASLTINHPKFKNSKVVSPPTEDEEGVIEVNLPLPN